MDVSIMVDGVPVGGLSASNLWADLLAYVAQQWEAETIMATITALQALAA